VAFDCSIIKPEGTKRSRKPRDFYILLLMILKSVACIPAESGLSLVFVCLQLSLEQL